MDEEESVSTPSTASVSTPQSPPMHGTKVRSLSGDKHRSSREKSRPSVFQGDGLEAFVEMYGSGDSDSTRSTHTPDHLLPPSPMERYEHWNEEEPWQPGETTDGHVAGKYSGEGDGGERERRLSSVVEDVVKVFSSTKEAPNQASNMASSATIEAEVNGGKDTIPKNKTHKSLVRDLMVLSQAERQKKLFTLGTPTRFRQRKHMKKDDGASVVAETGEEVGVGRVEKRKGKGVSIVPERGEYDSSLRLRSFSVSDEEEKRVKMAKVVDR